VALDVQARVAADAELERLYALHSRRVLAYCRRQLGGRGEAEDAAQTVFLHALRGLRAGVVPEVESAWLFTIAHNVCRTHWRSAVRRRRAEEQRDPHVLQEVAAHCEPDHDELFGLDDALSRLPETQRYALLLREWHGLPYREIAERMGTTQTAVEMLLFRARRSLASELRGERGLVPRRPVATLGELLSSLKIALGGSTAAKLAATGVIVAAAVSVGSSNVPQRHRPAPIHGRSAAASDDSPARVGHSQAAQPRSAHVVPRRERSRGAAPHATASPARTQSGPGLVRISPATASSSAQREAAPAAPEAPRPPQAAPSPPREAPGGSQKAPQAPAPPDLPEPPEAPPLPPTPAVPDLPPVPPVPDLPWVPGVPAPPALP